ncbi:hypothetical protein AAHA92_07024 [Salvia divinorum]
MATQNPVLYQLPVLEETISPSEIHQLLSLLDSKPTTRPTSSSETNRSVYSSEERRRRRMISNRESARRSRWRKKKHQEDLASESSRLKLTNRELENQLSTLTQHCHWLQRDSNQLLSESIYLQHRLAGLHEILATTMPLQ